MKTRAALLHAQPSAWQVCDVDLADPQAGEVLVRMVATGLCHSDDHLATGDTPFPVLPFCGGHEGAGIVERVGPGVTTLREGDHVVTAFVPSCGRCRWCAQGLQQLCDAGALLATGAQRDGTYRMQHEGRPVATMTMLGTFAEHQIFDEASCVAIPHDIPLRLACLLGCGVPTGWGSVTNAAETRPGDIVVVFGCGGVGMNAVQAAAHSGAAAVVAIDPVAFKREQAKLFGATHSYATLTDALPDLVSMTNGQGADAAVVAIGVVRGADLGTAFSAVRKGGTLVVTGLGRADEATIPVNLMELSMYQKRIQGCLYGNSSPRLQIPRLIDLYRAGGLKLDELITRTYSLDEVNRATEDLRSGQNVRGVILLSDEPAAGAAA